MTAAATLDRAELAAYYAAVLAGGGLDPDHLDRPTIAAAIELAVAHAEGGPR